MKKMRVQPVGVMLIYLLLVCMMVFIVMMPTVLDWEKEIDVWTWVYYIFFLSLLMVATILFLRSFEWAIITQDGIFIKSIFGQLNYLMWSEINDIAKEKKDTYNSRGAPIYKEWITIKKTNENVEKIGFNKKNKDVVWIIANKKNIEIIKLYSKKYKHIKVKI